MNSRIFYLSRLESSEPCPSNIFLWAAKFLVSSDTCFCLSSSSTWSNLTFRSSLSSSISRVISFFFWFRRLAFSYRSSYSRHSRSLNLLLSPSSISFRRFISFSLSSFCFTRTSFSRSAILVSWFSSWAWTSEFCFAFTLLASDWTRILEISFSKAFIWSS